MQKGDVFHVNMEIDEDLRISMNVGWLEHKPGHYLRFRCHPEGNRERQWKALEALGHSLVNAAEKLRGELADV